MGSKFRVDDIDTNIIQLLTFGKNNSEISSTVNVPLSTIQRRVRNLISNGLVIPHFQISYEQLGYNSGIINILVGNGDIHEIAKKIIEIDGITSVEIHIGNFDIVGHVMYKDRIELIDIKSTIKKIKGVRGFLWSEKIYEITKRQRLKLYRNDINLQKRMSI